MSGSSRASSSPSSRPLPSIGLVRPTAVAFQTGAAATVPLLALAAIAGALVEAFGPKIETDTQETLVLGLPLWLQLFAGASAGFTEEVLFRGYFACLKTI